MPIEFTLVRGGDCEIQHPASHAVVSMLPEILDELPKEDSKMTYTFERYDSRFDKSG